MNKIKQLSDFLDGKKQLGVSIVTAIASGTLIIHDIAQQGWPYILNLPHTPEFSTCSIAVISVFNALKGEKIRAALGTTPIIDGVTIQAPK